MAAVGFLGITKGLFIRLFRSNASRSAS